MSQQPSDSVEHSMTGRMVRINLVAAVAFILGGSLFALGAVFAQLGIGTLVKVNVTYLVGGFFFSLGGYASILLVVNATRDQGRSTESRMRWWSYQPRRRDWLSAVVLDTCSSKTSSASGAPSSGCRGACSRSRSVERTTPIPRTTKVSTLTSPRT